MNNGQGCSLYIAGWMDEVWYIGETKKSMSYVKQASKALTTNICVIYMWWMSMYSWFNRNHKQQEEPVLETDSSFAWSAWLVLDLPRPYYSYQNFASRMDPSFCVFAELLVKQAFALHSLLKFFSSFLKTKTMWIWNLHSFPVSVLQR